MKWVLNASESTVRRTLREAGYHQELGPQPNFSRRLRAGQAWPRFHLYIEANEASRVLADLHLDQKAETRHYQAVKAHNADYDGPLVEAEATRINNFFQAKI